MPDLSSGPDAPTVQRFAVGEAEAGWRLDQFIARQAQVSRRQARLWIGSGQVRLNGRALRILTRPVRLGANIQLVHHKALPLSEASPPLAAPSQKQALNPAASGKGPSPSSSSQRLLPKLLYQDPHILVVDKPSGLLSEPDRFGSPSVLAWAQKMLRAQGQKHAAEALRLVHRLDAVTSGVLVLACRRQAAASLSQAFRDRQVHKRYWALCAHSPKAQRIVGALQRLHGTRHAVEAAGKPAETEIMPLASGLGATLVQVVPHTGRTHQIRVHLSHIGHPLLGDGLYEGPRYLPDKEGILRAIVRTMLHALSLEFAHPKTLKTMRFEAPAPVDMRALALALDIDWPNDCLGASCARA